MRTPALGESVGREGGESLLSTARSPHAFQPAAAPSVLSLPSELLHSLRIEEMLRQVLSMLEMTKNALNEENLELALNVFSKDNFLDEINAAAPAVLTKYLETHPDNFLTCLELGTVIRKLERAGDHITNIAEEIVFFIDAKVLKHRDKVDEHFLGKEKTH